MPFLRILGGLVLVAGLLGLVATVALWAPLSAIMEGTGTGLLILWWGLAGLVPSLVLLSLGGRLVVTKVRPRSSRWWARHCIAGAVSIFVLAGGLWLLVPSYQEIFSDLDVALPTLTVRVIVAGRWLAGTGSPDQVVPGIVLAIPVLIALAVGCVWAARADEGAQGSRDQAG